MRKTLLIFLFLVSIVSFVFSQNSSNNKIFHALGFSFLTDFTVGPWNELTTFYPTRYNSQNSLGVYETKYNQNIGYTLFTYMYRFRYNVYEPSDNFAISLGITPAIGMTISTGGFANVNIPIIGEAEFGAGSTYSSSSNIGGFFGFGFEYTKMPLLSIESPSPSSGVPEAVSSWIEPVLTTGIRYWNSSNKMKEVNFKFGFRKSHPISDYFDRAISIRLAWIRFLNY